MKRAVPLLALAGVLAATPAYAQFDFLTELFDEVNSITVALQGSHIPGSGELRAREGDCLGIGICGMAAEVLIDLPSVGGADLELGLGTSFLRGFEAAEPTLDLHGSLRAFPTITAYASLPERLGLGIADPYVGASFGLTTLWHARGYDPEGVEYELEAETFEFGVSAGIYLLKPRGLFVEAGYRWRSFESVDWELPEAASERLPANWPRDLDLSGWQVSVGWQFRLRGDEDEPATPAATTPPPPVPASGTWTSRESL
ncbi:MAG TPA: hypothetical protein VF746_00845 [Longimicrobium sp.]|jgi:hypothetical protein